jgi:hypothetical protein
MTETVSLELIGRTVLETRDAVRKLSGVPKALRQLQDDQTVMIRMLQAREAELDLMRSLEQQYAGLRARLAEFERRLEKLEAVQ